MKNVFYMVVDRVTAQKDKIFITGTIGDGELIKGDMLEVSEVGSHSSCQTVAARIYDDGGDTYLANKRSGQISILTDLLFIPFDPSAQLFVCKKGEMIEAIAAFKASLKKEPEIKGFYGEDIIKNNTKSEEPQELEDDGFKIPKIKLPKIDKDKVPKIDKDKLPVVSDRMIKIGLLGLLALVLIVFGLKYFLSQQGDPIDPGNDDQTEEQDGTADTSDGTDGQTAREGIYQVINSDVTILSSDWDWDSSSYDSGSGIYRVDAVLFIHNDSAEPITQLEFTVSSQDDEPIFDGRSGSDTFTAYGYIPAGKKGFMVADIYTDEEKVRPDDETYALSGVYNNGSISTYTVPSGVITNNYGPSNDYYDVKVNNPNAVEVNSTARVIAVRTKGNKLKEGEASGRLTSSIGANASGFVQEKAFNNPNLHSKYGDMKVYLIDIDYLTTE